MRLAKCCVLYIVITKICVARKIIEELESGEPSDFVEAMIKDVTSCYRNQTKEIGFAGKPFTTTLRKQLLQPKHLVVLIDNTTRTVINGPVREDLRHKLQLFVVAASTSTELLQILRQIKESRWWNHMASFLIINPSSTSENGCSHAFEFLWIAWKMNLLNAKFLCYIQTTEGWIYGYNPYTSKSPESWQLVNTFTSKNDHPWTLFKRERRDDEVCHDLDFDKTADLGGYEIRVTIKYFYLWHVDYNKTGLDSLTGSRGVRARILFQTLNANAKLHEHYDADSPAFLDKNGRSILMEAANGYTDILLSGLYQRDVRNYTCTIPFVQDGIAIITQPNSEISQLGKLLTVLDINSRCGVLIVLFVTFIFFKYVLSMNSMSAFLNLFRLICNSSLTIIPVNVSARIYLSGLFIFMVTIQGIYQGQLSSLLAKSVSLPNVESFHDLAKQTHVIYGPNWYTYLFTDPIFKGRYIEVEDLNCLKYVLRDSSAACIGSNDILGSEAKKLNLHVSREAFRMMHVVFPIREDWPLEQRFNKCLRTIIEADLTHSRFSNDSEPGVDIEKVHQDDNENDSFRNLTLNQLAFAFVILGIGLILATAAFLVETYLERIRSKFFMGRAEIRI